MIDQFFHNIYVSHIETILLLIAAAVPLWSVVGAALEKRMRLIGAILAVISAAAILYVTVFVRERNAAGLHLIPFSSFLYAKENAEIYRSMLMNVFLFLPFGLSLPFALRGGSGRRMLLTVAVGAVLAVLVESIQFFAALGLAETDDVICNTLGTLIGSCAYPLSRLWGRAFAKQK